MKLFSSSFKSVRLSSPNLVSSRLSVIVSFSTKSKKTSNCCSTSLLKDYTYFEKYFQKFCAQNKMETIDYSKLTENEDLIVPTVWAILRKEAEAVVKKEELMRPLVEEAILQHSQFKDALSYRLATKLGGHLIPVNQWIRIFQEAYSIKQDDASYDLENAACFDLVAVKDRDPACDTLFTAFMFFKGYKALQIHRVSHVLWRAGRKELASVMQSRTSEVFAVDIHPGAKIGRGLMIDHATGLVIGETAVVGEHCSFLHGVTLGATGKDAGDRHPKIGNNVAIGCNASIIGNIRIGDNAKVGSGSIVVKPVPDNCTAVGAPARIIPPKVTPHVAQVVEANPSQQKKEPSPEVPLPHPNQSTHNDSIFSAPHVPLIPIKDSPISSHPASAVSSINKCETIHPNLNNLLHLIDIGNLPENLLLFLMPLLVYTLMSTGGCV